MSHGDPVSRLRSLSLLRLTVTAILALHVGIIIQLSHKLYMYSLEQFAALTTNTNLLACISPQLMFICW